MSITKNVPLNLYSSMKKKKEKDSDNFWHRKLTLKVRNQDFSTATCQTYVDLPKKIWRSAIFHSIKLPFDVEDAEKIFNGIYSIHNIATMNLYSISTTLVLPNLPNFVRVQNCFVQADDQFWMHSNFCTHSINFKNQD